MRYFIVQSGSLKNVALDSCNRGTLLLPLIESREEKNIVIYEIKMFILCAVIRSLFIDPYLINDVFEKNGMRTNPMQLPMYEKCIVVYYVIAPLLLL